MGANFKSNLKNPNTTKKEKREKKKIEIHGVIATKTEAIFALTVEIKARISVPAFDLPYNARQVI